MRPPTRVQLEPSVRKALETLLRARSCTVAEQCRARIALLADDGRQTKEIARELSISEDTVTRWRKRFAQFGIGEDVHAGLADLPRSGRPKSISKVVRAQIAEPLNSRDV